jgi:iron(III) transport system substrate-binding protein
MRSTRLRFVLVLVLKCPLICCLLLLNGCWSDSSSTVTVYTALDQDFSQPIFEGFEAVSDLSVAAKYDTESTKTVALTDAIMAESARPRCDVFWNNEILNTLRLEKAGLLEPYHSPHADDFPAQYRSPDGMWYGFAARARVLLVNTDLVAKEDRPDSILDLAAVRWRGRAGIAKPLFGTTATHVACLFAHWGEERAKKFLRQVKANDIRILAGNKQVALEVAAGRLAFGLTDTDDAMIELQRGMPVTIIYPDGQPGQLGTLLIPNTVAIIKDAPHPAAARRLVDYLLSPDVEARLAAGRSAQIPLRRPAVTQSRLTMPDDLHTMQVDFAAAAEQWDAAARFIVDEFTTN